MEKFLKFWFPVIFYSGIIYYVSSWPELSIPGQWKVDKVLHIAEFLPYGLLTARALASMEIKISLIVPGAVLLSALYGMTDEFHQLFVMGRSSDILDVFADALGGAGGAVIFLLVRKGRLTKHDAH